MDKRIADLDVVVSKLRKQFAKMNALIESLEETFYDAHKMKGWAFVHEPMWCTWSLEKFASAMSEVLKPYHRCLTAQAALVEKLRSHVITFEESRTIIAQWCAQVSLEENDFVSEWEDICAVEVDRWNTR